MDGSTPTFVTKILFIIRYFQETLSIWTKRYCISWMHISQHLGITHICWGSDVHAFEDQQHWAKKHKPHKLTNIVCMCIVFSVMLHQNITVKNKSIVMHFQSLQYHFTSHLSFYECILSTSAYHNTGVLWYTDTLSSHPKKVFIFFSKAVNINKTFQFYHCK